MILRILAIAFVALRLAAQSPPPRVLSDAQIEAQVKERLAKSLIGKDGFAVRVKGGVVYWEGSTGIAQHKGAATRMAKSAGARRVVNNIRVTGAKAPAKKADGTKDPTAPKPAAEVGPAVGSETPKVGQAIPNPKRVTVRWVPARH